MCYKIYFSIDNIYERLMFYHMIKATKIKFYKK
jgi:hypothetical protein